MEEPHFSFFFIVVECPVRLILTLIIIFEEYKFQNSSRRVTGLAEPEHKEIGRIVWNLVIF
jgi:hypothetical protein